MSVTTRHSASAYPFQCQAGLPLVGPVIGQEVLGQGMFCYDPFCLYDTETLLSPCMLVSGNKGYGKSAFVKAYLHRQAMAGKWLAILDPKGEYRDLAARDRLSVLALRPGGPVRLNPLEAGPTLAGSNDVGSENVRGRRISVVVALAESASGRPVTSDERSVVTAALMELERQAGRRAPTLRHVMHRLMCPTKAMAEELHSTSEDLAADAKSVARGLHRLIEGDLAGMFDGHSTTTVDWSGPGIVVDLSAVLQSPGFSAIVVCAGAWLAQVVAAKDRQRIIVVDEGWKAIRDAAFVAWGEETMKLSRAYGVQFVTVVQRISDLAAQADDGTATAKRAQGFVTEAETKVTFNLSGAEARASTDVMDWTESETLLVPRLPGAGPYGGSASTGPSSRRSSPRATCPCATATRPCGAGHDHVGMGTPRNRAPGVTRTPVKILATAAGVCLFSVCALAGGAPAFITDNSSPPASTIPVDLLPVLEAAATGSPCSVPWTLLAAVAATESGFDPTAVSGAGAEGLFQFEPATFAAYATPVPADGARPASPFDPVDAAYAAGRYLCSLGVVENPTLALVAYNCGNIGPACRTASAGYAEKVLITAAGYAADDTASDSTTDPGAA